MDKIDTAKELLKAMRAMYAEWLEADQKCLDSDKARGLELMEIADSVHVYHERQALSMIVELLAILE